MSVEFTVYDNKLRIVSPQQREIEFQSEVDEVMFVDGIFVVLLKRSNEYKSFRNVFGVNLKGEIVWQIDEPKTRAPFTNFYRDNDEFYVHNWAGFLFNLDPKTGEVLKIIFSK